MNLNLPFDKVYCLHLAESSDRLSNTKSIVDNFGAEIWWTCKRAISNPIGDAIQSLRTPYYEAYRKPDTYGNCFNCSFEHYTMIKTAYLRGFNHIMIMEDDVIPIESEEKLQQLFDNLPEDWDLIKLYSTHGTNLDFDINNLFVKDIHHWSTACYALSRKGMEEYIRILDNYFCVADMTFELFNKQKLNCYSVNHQFFKINDNFESNII